MLARIQKNDTWWGVHEVFADPQGLNYIDEITDPNNIKDRQETMEALRKIVDLKMPIALRPRSFNERVKFKRSLELLENVKQLTRVLFVVPMYKEMKRLGVSGEDALRMKVAQLVYLSRQNIFFDWRLLFIDDGTPGLESKKVIERLWQEIRAEYAAQGIDLSQDKVRVMAVSEQEKKETKSRKGYATKLAMQNAVDDGWADFIGYTDVDISTNLLQTPLLLDELASGRADAAIGSRYAADADAQGISAERVKSSSQYLMVVHTLLPPLIGIHDTQRGFKLFRRDMLHKILPFTFDPGLSFDTELLLLTKLARGKISEVGISWFDSAEESTINLGKDAYKMLLGVMKQTRLWLNPIVLLKLSRFQRSNRKAPDVYSNDFWEWIKDKIREGLLLDTMEKPEVVAGGKLDSQETYEDYYLRRVTEQGHKYIPLPYLYLGFQGAYELYGRDHLWVETDKNIPWQKRTPKTINGRQYLFDDLIPYIAEGPVRPILVYRQGGIDINYFKDKIVGQVRKDLKKEVIRNRIHCADSKESSLADVATFQRFYHKQALQGADEDREKAPVNARGSFIASLVTLSIAYGVAHWASLGFVCILVAAAAYYMTQGIAIIHAFNKFNGIRAGPVVSTFTQPIAYVEAGQIKQHPAIENLPAFIRNSILNHHEPTHVNGRGEVVAYAVQALCLPMILGAILYKAGRYIWTLTDDVNLPYNHPNAEMSARLEIAIRDIEKMRKESGLVKNALESLRYLINAIDVKPEEAGYVDYVVLCGHSDVRMYELALLFRDRAKIIIAGGQGQSWPGILKNALETGCEINDKKGKILTINDPRVKKLFQTSKGYYARKVTFDDLMKEVTALSEISEAELIYEVMKKITGQTKLNVTLETKSKTTPDNFRKAIKVIREDLGLKDAASIPQHNVRMLFIHTPSQQFRTKASFYAVRKEMKADAWLEGISCTANWDINGMTLEETVTILAEEMWKVTVFTAKGDNLPSVDGRIGFDSIIPVDR